VSAIIFEYISAIWRKRTGCYWKVRTKLGMSSIYQKKKKVRNNMCPEIFLFVSYSWNNTVVTFCDWYYDRPASFATSACRQPLPRFPLTRSGKATSRVWRMRDGAPVHFSRAVRGVLSNTCHDRRIGRGHTAWPPRSPDLNPLHFYLWGHLFESSAFLPLGTPIRILRIFTCGVPRDDACAAKNWDTMIFCGYLQSFIWDIFSPVSP
jgi:hypothetical protein